MNVNAILEWIKENVFIVIFSALIVAAPIAMWIVTSGMNAQIQKDVADRAKHDAELTRLEKTDISSPDGSVAGTGVVNERFLARYTEVADIMASDAQAVQHAAVQHNHKNRIPVLSNVLPDMPSEMRDVLPRRFHEALTAAYDKLLASVGAGQPPALQSLREELEQKRVQFITQDLRKDLNDKLEPDELNRLRDELTKLRMARYAESAARVSMYLSAADLNIPAWSQEHQPSPHELFNWQWQLWAISDVLNAFHEVNKSDRTVLRSPVKHILALNVFGLPGSADPAQAAGSGSGSGSGMGMGMGMGVGGVRGGGDGGGMTEGEAAPVATGVAPNPKLPVPLDFSLSYTGRKSNSLYDVLDIQVELVVETSRLPHVIDALARYNFITVTELTLTNADPFEAAQLGYIYGPEPVSKVTMNLQTVWLREWTQKFMPKSVKQTLGLPVDMPPPPPSA